MLNTKPYPYQMEGSDMIQSRFKGRALLADEMGLGKSLQALLFAAENPSLRPGVIVCPASLKWHWQRECSTHYSINAKVLEGMKPDVGQLGPTPEFIVINYDILGPWLPYLKSIHPQVVILDESSAIKSRKALRTHNVRELCKGVPNVVALSGTPLTNRPAELWTTLNLLRPDLYPSFWPFAKAHCDLKRNRFGWDTSGASNLPQLHKKLRDQLMIRRLKKDVLQDLPSKSRHVLPLPMENGGKEYIKAKGDFLGWMRSKGHSTSGAEKAEAVVKMGMLKRLAAKLKMKGVIDWVDDFFENDDGKLILFVVHREMGDTLHKQWEKQSVQVHGGVIGHERQKAFDQFTHDKRTRLLVGNIQAAGLGWNGTAASTVAFAEMGWTPAEHTQAEDRVHRIGTKSAATAWYLVAKDSIEEKLAHLIQKKQAVLDATLDGGPQEDSFDIYDQLAQMMEDEG